jgi:hypothetical protein
MAIDGHSKYMRTSIHGRRFGHDDYENLTGAVGRRNGHETLTAASTLHPGGTSLLNAPSSAVFELPPPAADLVGITKRIISISTGAAPQYVKLTAGNFLVNGQSTHSVCSLTTRGVAVDLEYITTAFVSVLTHVVATTGSDIIEFTTST